MENQNRSTDDAMRTGGTAGDSHGQRQDAFTNANTNDAGRSSSSLSDSDYSTSGTQGATGSMSSGSTASSGSSYSGSASGTVSGARTGRMLTGMFRDNQSAESAYSSLTARGYKPDDIDVMMSDSTRDKYYKNVDADDRTDLGNKAMEGAGKGSAIGGTLGAIAGAVAAIGTSLLIPGLGLVVAGPLAGALAGAGAGGLTGGLIGGLVGHGIPEDHAKRYEEGVRNGNIVMGVHAREDDDIDDLEREWRETHRAEDTYR